MPDSDTDSDFLLLNLKYFANLLMFEGLLEKLLANYFGKYISGLDSNNLHLGVWSGNVIIENVNLKSDIFDQFDFPLDLVFSSIGDLNFKNR